MIWNFACLMAPVVTTTSVILSSNKIQHGDVLVPANPGPPGKWPLNRERDKCIFGKKVNTMLIAGYISQ